MSEAVTPFILNIPDAELEDLRDRLARTRWPEKEPVEDWSQGAKLASVQGLCDYWRTKYDWRRCESTLNALGQFKTELYGLNIHFLHVRSKHEDAMPLLLSHGWPGSIIEFLKCVAPLTDPTAHGGKAEDAFHLVIPSLPGYGFSDKPTETGWGVGKIAAAWGGLMQRLGCERYVAQGGDWGAAVTSAMGMFKLPGLAGIHVNLPLIVPRDPGPNPSEKELRMLEQLKFYQREENGYSAQQMTKPQTLGYALADSPAGQAAWIYEKFKGWTDNAGAPEDVLAYDELLDNIMLYWLPNTAASSARLYRESFREGFFALEIDIPTGVSVFPKDIFTGARSYAEKCMHQLVYWNELDRGGHFAAFEQPALFVEELRKCFRLMR